MSKRLAEVASELGVSTKQITEFLTSQSIEIPDKPGAKVSDDAYRLLQKNFQKSIAIKEKAEQLNIGARKKEEKKGTLRPWEIPTLNQKEPKTLKSPVENRPVTTEETPIAPEKQEVTAKQETVVVPTEQKTQDQHIKTQSPQLSGPKILGKINLDEMNPRKEKQDKEQRRPKEEKAMEKEPIAQTPVKQPEKTVEVEVVEQKAPEQKAQPETQAPVSPESPVFSTTEAEDGDKIERIEAPQLRGLKILGKINLDSQVKKKKKKKDRREKLPLQKDKVATATPTGSVKTEGGVKNNESRPQQGQGQNQHRQHHHHNNNQNQGQGNYQHRQNQGQGQGNQQNPAANNNNSQNQNNNSGGDKKKLDKAKPGTGKPAVTTDDDFKKGAKPGLNKPAAGAGVNKKRGGVPDPRQVEENIKQTMARVQAGKKKNFGATRSARDARKEQRAKEMEELSEENRTLQITEFVSVSELAALMEVSPTDIITTCMDLGIFVSINQRLDAEIIEMVADEFQYKVEFVSAEEQLDLEDEEEDNPEDLEHRAPIVTVMGHVDHGKTSLLDYIRKANVAGGEAGGITQHIGAYEVKVGDKKITFLDTPGHEAFTAMRARGAKVTDIAVIIIAADDSVMPQTKEAIAHAQAAAVPIVFAINKVDKDGAQPDKIRQELASMNLLVEEWGGKYQSQEISAKKGLNVDLLLEKILLEAEMLELKANPHKKAQGTILEASLEKGRGYVAKVLVQNGTLHIGDVMICGQHYGKVKAMFNERGKRVKDAGPSTPVLVLGLDGAPQAGEKIKVLDNERDAKDLANKRAQITRQQQIRATKRITLDEIGRRLALGNFKKLNLIVKGDMDGSVEALSDSLLKLSTGSVQVEIVHKGVGQITETDVLLASASDAIIVGFQVRPNSMARRLAEQEGVEIKTYSVIYSAIEEIKSALEGMLEPKKVEKELGLLAVQQVFKISKVGTIAGCLVQEGKIHRNNFIRVIRNGIVIYPTKEGAHGKVSSLRRFKDMVTEVKAGLECGISIDGFNDLEEGDSIEVYEIVEVKQTLS
jgi:translation initiation factor IF-2